VLGGLVAYYAWLLTHCIPDWERTLPLLGTTVHVLPNLPWVLPIVLPVVGGWRSLANVGRIMDIAAYMLKTEEELDIGPRKGWEHFLEYRRGRPRVKLLRGSHTVFWVLVIGATVLIFSFGQEISRKQCALEATRELNAARTSH